MTEPPHPGDRPRTATAPDEEPHPVRRSPAGADTQAKPPPAAETPVKPPSPAKPLPTTDASAKPLPTTGNAAKPLSAADASAKPSSAADAPPELSSTTDSPAKPPPAADGPAPLSPALDKTFKIGLVLKGLDGVLEVIGGILLLFLSPQAIQHLVRVLTAHELSEDPHDVIARYLLHTASHLHHGTTLFGAVYLLSHGIAKVVLVALVLRDKLWAYPLLIGLLLAFIVYQLYQITVVHFSAGLTALTIFDALLVWLTWREYRAKRAARAHPIRAPLAAPSPSGQRPARPRGGQKA